MNEKNELIVSLLYKSVEGQHLTEIEKRELEQWLSRSEYNTIVYNEVMDLPAMKTEIQSALRNYDSVAQWAKIMSRLSLKPVE
jgi:hypothetical protein